MAGAARDLDGWGAVRLGFPPEGLNPRDAGPIDPFAKAVEWRNTLPIRRRWATTQQDAGVTGWFFRQRQRLAEAAKEFSADPERVEEGQSELLRPTMATDSEIEVEAEAILREAIQRSGWYFALRGEERSKLIEQDVERHWHLMMKGAVKRLETRRRGGVRQ